MCDYFNTDIKCPHDHEYGKDWLKYPECADCEHFAPCEMRTVSERNNRQDELKCASCGRIRDLRMGHCFDCAVAESIIADGTDMYDNKVANTPMEKLKEVIRILGLGKE